MDFIEFLTSSLHRVSHGLGTELYEGDSSRWIVSCHVQR